MSGVRAGMETKQKYRTVDFNSLWYPKNSHCFSKGGTVMKLSEAWGKFVRITTDDGQVFEGKAYDYTSALDNEPDPASISIGDTELFESEVVSIEELPS